MHMTMRLRRIPFKVMLMLMVFIMHMSVPVLRRLMQMFMGMPLRQVQPNPHGHQRRRNPERDGHRLPERQQGYYGAQERRRGEVGTGARTAQPTQRQHKHDQADAIPQKPHQQDRRQLRHSRYLRA